MAESRPTAGRILSGSGAPAIPCNTGAGRTDAFVRTDVSPPAIYLASATNVWSQVGGSDAAKANLAGGNAFTGLQTFSVGQTTSAQTDLLINPTTKASGNFILCSVNGAAKLTVASDGSALFASTISSSAVQSANANGYLLQGNGGNGQFATGFQFQWTSSASYGGTVDTTLSRSAANTLQVGTTTANALGHLKAASLRGNAVAFASLPATPVEGMMCGVTDSNTAIWGATIAAGGANHVLAYYNGTNWTVAGK